MQLYFNNNILEFSIFVLYIHCFVNDCIDAVTILTCGYNHDMHAFITVMYYQVSNFWNKVVVVIIAKIRYTITWVEKKYHIKNFKSPSI